MDNVLSSMEELDSNSSTSDNPSIQNNYSQVLFINNTGKYIVRIFLFKFMYLWYSPAFIYMLDIYHIPKFFLLSF